MQKKRSSIRLSVVRKTAIALALVTGACATTQQVFDLNSGVSLSETNSRPRVFVSPEVDATQQDNLSRLLAQSEEIIFSDDFLRNAEALDDLYPELFVRGDYERLSISQAVRLLRAPPSGFSYTAMPLVVDPNSSGAAVTSSDNEWTMTISPSTLSNWSSDDTVERSCAVNTVSHELTHTLHGSNGSYVFVDSGFGLSAWVSRRAGTTGSYVLGQLAQCTWLQQQGRISADEVRACMPVFYQRRIFPRKGVLAAGRCSQYPEGTPVAL